MRKALTRLATSCCLLLVLILPGLVSAQSDSKASGQDLPSAARENAKSKTSHSKHRSREGTRERSAKAINDEPASTPSDTDVVAAKSSGKVWVNLDSGIYHKGGRWYGKTRNGKFMTEAEAKATGYKASQRN